MTLIQSLLALVRDKSVSELLLLHCKMGSTVVQKAHELWRLNHPERMEELLIQSVALVCHLTAARCSPVKRWEQSYLMASQVSLKEYLFTCPCFWTIILKPDMEKVPDIRLDFLDKGKV